ncbi:hypothetical protein Ae201684P_016213 [Aphanomyces euteiches]|nr:hypothetical protein Ae201684P_016213 [Aphanomyces euteiches]
MNCWRIDRPSLLPVLEAVTAPSLTLLGPLRSRKQIVDNARFTSKIGAIMNSIQSEHPVFSIVHKILEQHLALYGTGGTILTSLVHVLAKEAIDLQHIPSQWICKGVCEEVARKVPSSSPFELLGPALSSTQADQRAGMSTALQIAETINGFNLQWRSRVHFIPLMGVASSCSIYPGLILPLREDDDVFESLLPIYSNEPRAVQRLALVQDDVNFSPETVNALLHVDLLVTSGTICLQTVDWCRSHRVFCLTTSLRGLTAVSAMCATPVCETIMECIVTRTTTTISSLSLHGQPFAWISCADQPNNHVSVVVSGETSSLVSDAQAMVETSLSRLAHAIYDNAMLPGGGAAFMACAASIHLAFDKDDSDVAVAALAFGHALHEWCLHLVLNGDEMPFLEAKTHLIKIQAAYLDGFQESPRFLETTHFGRSLTPLWYQSNVKFDGFKSTKAALSAAARVVCLVVHTGHALVNRPISTKTASEEKKTSTAPLHVPKYA